MKKILAIVLCLLTLAIFATGCAKTVTANCDYCNQEKSCTEEKIGDETVYVCGDSACKTAHDVVKGLADAFK